MDFSLSPEIEDYRQRIKTFVDERVIPLEKDPASYDQYEYIKEEVLEPLRAEAKTQGLWALGMPKERGGQGLPIIALAACYEEMNRSIFGPACFNCQAPDDGNMILLNKVGTDEQKARWLQPIIDGQVRSSFAMTEPAPGAGSDPAGMMLTRAEKVGNKWVIRGRKWFITGADGAKHFILIARTSDDPRRGLSAFLFHADQPGWKIERRIEIMGPEEHGGHCEITFDGLEVEPENMLMGEGDGLKATQVRLGTARLTHCMRWLGMCKRALEICTPYVKEREGFGMKVIDHEVVQQMLGQAAMNIHIGRQLVMNAAWKLDQGDFARKEVSVAKVFMADTLYSTIDTAIQLMGARGYSKDEILEWMYRYARLAHLADGTREVHMMVLSRFLVKEGSDFWAWPVADI